MDDTHIRPRQTPAGKRTQRDTRNLRIVLEITFKEACPLHKPPSDLRSVEIMLNKGGCQSEFILEADSSGTHRVEHQRVQMSGSAELPECVCHLFDEFDCIPHIVEASEESVRIATYVPDRAAVRTLLTALQNACESVQLIRISDNDKPILHQVREIDLSHLSEKQRTALRKAVAADYFQPGSQITLKELADDLGISTSALSQRLVRAEAEILNQVFG